MPVFFVLAVGVLAISSASILIRFLPGVPALAIAAWRLTFSSIITLPFTLKRNELENVSSKEYLLGILGGFFLALHFSLWITSIKLTTVASAVVLGTTTPIWVSIISHFFLKEKNTLSEWIGILISVFGGFLVGFGDIGLSSKALLGDVLALVSAWAITIYFIIGRRLRKSLPLLAYTSIVYTASSLFLIIFCLATNVPLFAYSRKEFSLLFLLAVLPQLVGHNALNWALARLKASIVTLSVLAEAVVSGTLAAIIFKEFPPTIALLGYGLIIGGVVFTARKQR
ncbi:MAG: DMT family transporter [Actinobacteria bacterium]|nr:DMT family transporter [Actinomycetota bacterium]